MAGVHLDAMSEESMKTYFDLLRNVYDEFDFENHPEAIIQLWMKQAFHWNLDPPPPPKVTCIAKRGQKVRCRTSGQKVQITVIGCGNATGQVILSSSSMQQKS